MNNNEHYCQLESLLIKAIKDRDLWGIGNKLSLINDVFGSDMAKKIIRKILAYSDPRLSINDTFWLRLNVALPYNVPKRYGY